MGCDTEFHCKPYDTRLFFNGISTESYESYNILGSVLNNIHKAVCGSKEPTCNIRDTKSNLGWFAGRRHLNDNLQTEPLENKFD
jgi:hypothetical protein